MQFEARIITLKDGRTAILRPGTKADAQGCLDYLRAATREAPFLLRSAAEADEMTLQGEEHWLEGNLANPYCMSIMAEVEGEIAGNCEIGFFTLQKLRHRSNIGIGLKQKYWGLGIGTAMFRMMEEEARRRPEVRQMELEFIEGNSRARYLYEKMGFRITGMRPDAILMPDGTIVNEYIMQKKL